MQQNPTPKQKPTTELAVGLMNGLLGRTGCRCGGVLLIAATDVLGFTVFPGLATLILL